MTPTPQQIQSTTIYQELVKKTPFLCNILVQKHIRERFRAWLLIKRKSKYEALKKRIKKGMDGNK